jgi:hypothetical protein
MWVRGRTRVQLAYHGAWNDGFTLQTTNAQAERADFCWVPSGGMESAEHEGSEPSEGQHVFWFARVMPNRGNCLGV